MKKKGRKKEGKKERKKERKEGRKERRKKKTKKNSHGKIKPTDWPNLRHMGKHHSLTLLMILLYLQTEA